MKRNRLLWGCLTALLALAACEDDTSAPSKETTTEEWLTQFLHTEYLWCDEAKEKTPDASSPERLFYSLLSDKDGKDRADGTHYYYSYIEKKTSTKSIDATSSYGFEFVLYQVVGDIHADPYYYARILYVLPDTPASRAGLQRGDWLFYLNGTRITSSNYRQLANGGAIELTVSRSTTQLGRKVKVEASEPVEENPIFKDTLLMAGNTKVGYLAYNQFRSGLGGDASDGTYDNQLRDLFQHFREAGATEFVLDLRYNSGGLLSSAQLLAGCLAPAAHRGSTFCYLEDSRGRKDAYPMTGSYGGNLDLRRLFVLTSSQTASASEAVINGLRPYMEVIQIGGRTEGKNVGSIHEEHGEWAIQPIVYRIYNAKQQSDYASGLVPTASYACDELKTSQNATLLPLGDPKEFMLSKALAAIQGTKAQTASAPTAPAAETGEPVYRSLADKPVPPLVY